MQRTLHEHLTRLEEKVAALKTALSESALSEVEKADLRLELDLAQRAVAHFRKAFDLEQRLSK